MNRRLIQFVLIALLLSACVGKNNSSVDPGGVATATPVSPAYLLPVDRVIVHSASYTITVKYPARALTDLQRAVEQSGGYVSSASSWSGDGSASYASLSAKVPPEALPALNAAINKIADKIQNQSEYVQDVTADVQKLQQRYADLSHAHDELLLFLINGKQLDRLSTFGILQELLDTELKSVESQLESYAQQAKLGSFDVTINQPASVYPAIE